MRGQQNQRPRVKRYVGRLDHLPERETLMSNSIRTMRQ